MRNLSKVGLISLCLSCSANPVWQVAMTTDKTGRLLTVSNEMLSVTLTEKDSWTIREIWFEGTLMVGRFGANGAVASVKPAARMPEAKDGWMGTGHGFETVKTHTIIIDEKPVDLKPGDVIDAKIITLTKDSNIGPLDQIAEICFPETGDRLIERTRFTANRSLEDSLNFVYAYMHCNENALTDWRAWLDPQNTEDGQCIKDDQTFSLNKDVLAIAMFGPKTGKGIVYVYPEVYAGGPRGNFFWDRTRDNKLYFQPKIPGVISSKGDTCQYVLTVVPFSAKTSEWQEEAGKTVAASIGKNEIP